MTHCDDLNLKIPFILANSLYKCAVYAQDIVVICVEAK